jgi:hypothetical protein
MLLHQNVVAGDLGRVRALVDAGADLNCRDHSGATPLVTALKRGYVLRQSRDPYDRHLAIAGWLIERGCDVHAVDTWGRTARDWALGVAEIERLLDERGARSGAPMMTAEDRGDFPPGVHTFLALLRRGPVLAEPDRPRLAGL